MLTAIRATTGRFVDFLAIYANPRSSASAGWRSPTSSTTGCWTSSPPSARRGPFEAYREVVETGAPWQQEVAFDGIVGGSALAGVFEMRAVKLGDGILVTYRG